jgi:hypothetical protein
MNKLALLAVVLVSLIALPAAAQTSVTVGVGGIFPADTSSNPAVSA